MLIQVFNLLQVMFYKIIYLPSLLFMIELEKVMNLSNKFILSKNHIFYTLLSISLIATLIIALPRLQSFIDFIEASPALAIYHLQQVFPKLYKCNLVHFFPHEFS